MGRCHRARMGWDGMDLRKRKDVDEAPARYVCSCQPVADAPKPSSLPLTASLSAQSAAARGHISTPGQASKTTICSGSRRATSVRGGFGRCERFVGEER